MPDPTPDVPRRTLPAREAITFARGSIADARRALAAARAASRPTPDPAEPRTDPGAVVVRLTENAQPRPAPAVDPLLIGSAVAAGLITHEQGEALARGRDDREQLDPATERVQGAAGTMRAAAQRLRDPYRCNSDPRVDRLVADWLDSAAYDAEEIGPDFRAERVAAAILDRPDPHPGASSPTQVRASLARGLAQSAAGDVRDRGDFTRYADADDADDGTLSGDFDGRHLVPNPDERNARTAKPDTEETP